MKQSLPDWPLSSLRYPRLPRADLYGRVSQVDMNALTDARIAIVKATLQLTPDQEKYWSPIEQAIRQRRRPTRAPRSRRGTDDEDGPTRSPRKLEKPQSGRADGRRADNMAQRAANLKKLADAWQPSIRR